MKKHHVSFLFTLAILSLALVFAVPAVSNAQTTAPTCPAGYTCTPTPVVPSCPAGYICVPTNPGGGSSGGGGGGSVTPIPPVTGVPVVFLANQTGKDAPNVLIGGTQNYVVGKNLGGISSVYLNSASPGDKNTFWLEYASALGTTLNVVLPGNSSIPNGQYYLIIINSYGTSTPFLVSVSNSVPAITVVSPNGGEVYSSSGVVNFSGTVNYAPKNLVGYLYSPVNGNVASKPLVVIAGKFKDTFSGDPGIGSGQYKITVCDLLTDSPAVPGKSLCDSSNDYFTVVPSNSGGGGSGGGGSGGGNSGGSGSSCYVFSTNLTIGSRGADVVALQTWLIAHGFDIPAISSGRQPKGIFSSQTADALAKYQRSVGIPPTGFLGPLTRGSINGSCVIVTPPPQPTQPVITRVSAPASEDFEVYAGTKFAIEGTNLAGNSLATTKVYFANNGKDNAQITQLGDTLIWAVAPTDLLVGKTYELYVSNEKGTSKPVQVRVPGVNATLPSLKLLSPKGGEVLQEGQQYTINWSSQNIPSSDLIIVDIFNGSSATISNPNNQIAALPSTATSYSWTVGGNNGWGLGMNDSWQEKLVKALGINQAEAANNQYVISVRAYNPATYAQDTYSSSGIFTINLSTNQSPISVITPNGGETWQIGQTYTISFHQPSTNAGSLIYLDRGYPADSPKTGINSSLLIATAAAGAQSVSYAVSQNIASWPGLGDNYKIKVCNTDGSGCDSSDSYFKISNQSTTACPAGYLCAPLGQSVACPGGYVCTPVAGLNTCPTGYTCYVSNPANTGTPSITVVSPNGGETYKVGDTLNIRWNTSNFGSLNIWLTLADKYGTSVPGGKLNAANIPNTGSYNWSIPSDLVPAGTSGAFRIVASSFDTGPSASDLSDSAFNVTSGLSSVNKPPVISGITAPTQLQVNQTGTWSLKASDPENGPLSYSVDWGDSVCPKGYVCGVPVPIKLVLQGSTFTHSYSTAGTYNVSFTVQDNAGQTAQSSATVRVVNDTSQTGALSFSMDSINFAYTQGGAVPPNQQLLFTNTSNVNVNYTLRVNNQPTWLNTGYNQAVLISYPGSASVTGVGASVDPSGLAPGTYTTTLVISGNFTNSPKNIPITLTVTSAASAALSLDPASPLTSSVPVTDTANNSYLGLPLLVFDLNAQGGPIILKSLVANISSPTGGSGGSLTNAYLYQGSTLVSSAVVQPSGTQFTNLPNGTPGTSIPAGSTLPYTIKVDVSNVTSGPGFTVSANVQSTGLTLLPASGGNSSVPVTGSANGNTMTVLPPGPLFTLVGTPTITKTTLPSNGATTTVQYSATFNVSIQAIGSSVTLGLPGSTIILPAFAATPSLLTIYKNGVPDSPANYPVTVSYSQPSNTLSANSNTAFTIGTNQSATALVTVTFIVTNPGANTYGVQLNGVNWSTAAQANQTTSFSGSTWRTNSAMVPSATYASAPSQQDLTASIWDAIRLYYNGQ